jgi:Na+-transporting methylmalonyl-CoA/oxaloacetate decarboxylase gamma subunit
MTQLEAWIVTALGMVVVFIGLVLCIAFIQLFNRIARRISWGDEGHGGHAAPPHPVPEPAPAVPADLPPGDPVPPDVLAVIAAVLEVESKLYLSKPGSRLTIRRPAPQY